MRQGDSVLACVAGNTRATIGFFSSMGVCYTARMIDIPASTGFGEPVQKLFKMKDGDKIVAAMSFDRARDRQYPRRPQASRLLPRNSWVCRVDQRICPAILPRTVRRTVHPQRTPVCPGRQRARRSSVSMPIDGTEVILAVSRNCRAMVCAAEEINYLSGAGKGVTLIRLAKDDELLGFKASKGDRDLLTVETNRGAKKTISTAKYRVTSRGGRGTEIQKNGKISEIITPPPEAPPIV